MAKKEFASTGPELVKLIKEVSDRLKNGDVMFPEINSDSLFQVNKYHHLKDFYRELLVKTVFLDDEVPIKKDAYAFIGKIIEATGEFDVSVVLAMTYHKITPLTAEFLCKYANEIGEESMVGYIIHNTLKSYLDKGVHHDVINKVHTTLSQEETERIRKTVGAFRKFAK